MSHHIVRHADKLLAAVAAYFNKRIVAISNDALEVGLGNNDHPIRQRNFNVGDW
jgi:hypothetical protein